MERVVSPELMDDPGVPRGDLEASLRYLRVVNRRLGGVSALLRHLRAWSRSWPRDRPVTLLDIGTGSADLPLAARAWAGRAGFDLRVTGVDVHETTLELARRHVGDEPGIELVRADATRLMEIYDDRFFDYVHAGLFLHHLSEIRVLTVLRIMDRLARRGVVWNDLVRTPLAAGAVRVLTLGRPRIVRHDALASVRAGFTRREALDLARRAGLESVRYRWSLPTHRFTVAGERAGAWSLP